LLLSPCTVRDSIECRFTGSQLRRCAGSREAAPGRAPAAAALQRNHPQTEGNRALPGLKAPSEGAGYVFLIALKNLKILIVFQEN
jgi:hypothetical protein